MALKFYWLDLKLVTNRYKIPFLAVDLETASEHEQKAIEIICFWAVADEMVESTADSIVAASSNVQGFIPEQIKRMYGAKYDFSLSVPRGAVRFGRTSFRIDSFVRITELEEQVPPQMALGMCFHMLGPLCTISPHESLVAI